MFCKFKIPTDIRCIGGVQTMLKKKELLREMLISARGRGEIKNDSSSPMVVSGAVVRGLIHSHLKLLGRLL